MFNSNWPWVFTYPGLHASRPPFVCNHRARQIWPRASFSHPPSPPRLTMSALSSLSKFLPSINSRERPADPLSHLRFVLETMPGSRKYLFTAATRAEILSELYDAFWGSYAHLFLPNSNSSLPLHATLSQVQSSLGFSGAGKEAPVLPGRPCGHILKKGESCFRCKCVASFIYLLAIFIRMIPGIVHSTIAASFVPDVSMRQTTPDTMSVSSSPSNLVDAVIVATRRHGELP